MVKVYIASPYTKGDTGDNVHNHMTAASDLINFGFAPYAPLLNHFQHIFSPYPYEVWMKIDMEFLGSCDCVLRLPGDSPGADREVEKAVELGLPVFSEVMEVVRHYLKPPSSREIQP